MLNSINSDLIRGHIDTIILSVLREGDRYGYDILGEIEKKSGGQYSLKQPTLYSCLKRLEGQGFIYKYWGTESGGGRRTYYSLTEMGKELFLKNKDEWEHSRGVIDMLIASADSPVRPYILLPAGQNSDDAQTKEQNTEEDADYIAAKNTDQETGEQIFSSESDQNFVENNGNAANEDNISASQATIDNPDKNENELSEKLFDDILAEKESDRLLSESENIENISDDDKLRGVSYANRLEDDPGNNKHEKSGVSDNLYESVYSTNDYFTDYDGEDEHEVSDDSATQDTAAKEADHSSTYYNTDDRARYSFASTQEAINADKQGNKQAEETTTDSKKDENKNTNVFRSYEDDADISEDAQRELIIQREYRNVIRELLHGEYHGNAEFTSIPSNEYSQLFDGNDERAAADPSEGLAAYSTGTDSAENSGQIDFSSLLTAVRSMGDDIRIRTHNSNADKEYNSVYQYYSNKLLLYKYGILFLLMAAEILIPYLIIKFAVGIPIRYEILTLVLSITGAALLTIYAAIANLIDPYKRKRYDFSLKNSVLFRLAVMALMLVLIYAVNVVLFMDISFDAEYAFSLITPALLSTNIPLSPIIFQALYDTKKFNVEG